MTDTESRDWRTLSRLGGACAFVALGGMILDIALTMLPGWGAGSVPTGAAAWFAQFASDPLLGMRNLDFLNITMSLVALPMYVAIWGTLRRSAPGLAALGLLLTAIGTALFIAANAALPMAELSQQYGAASDPATRAALLGAAEALLARGAHGSYGSYPGFLLSELGTLLVALAMLRGTEFGKRVAWVGVTGVGILLAYTTAYTFSVGADALVMTLAIPGGLLMIAWHAMVGRRLLSTGGPPSVVAPALAERA